MYMDNKLLNVEEAQEIIFSKFKKLEDNKVPILESKGSFLSEDIYAPFNLPERDNSAMDGFAARYQDIKKYKNTKFKLKVIGRVSAESVPSKTLGKDEAVRIMTGGIIPKGANCVIPFENTNSNPLRGESFPPEVVVNKIVEQYDNIRNAGQDYKKEEKVLTKGEYLDPSSIGVLASFGKDSVLVSRKPEISILSTGNEIVSPGNLKKEGQIYDSNSFTIASAIRSAGGQPKLNAIVPDKVEMLEKILEKSSSSDLIVSIGGVSKGDFDLIKDVLGQKGKINFWGINMRPGKPLTFGILKLNNKEIFQIGLPGNPVSAYVCFELFIRPIILKMIGAKNIFRKIVKARIDTQINNSDGRRIYARVKLISTEKGYKAEVYKNQNSNILSSLVFADGLAICPDGCKVLKSGELVDVMLIK